MPLRRASTMKPATSASDTRFEIVMVKRSLAAANAIRAGNSRRRAMSRIMDLLSPAANARSEHRRSLAARDEQSGNGGCGSPDTGNPGGENQKRQRQRQADQFRGRIAPAAGRQRSLS